MQKLVRRAAAVLLGGAVAMTVTAGVAQAATPLPPLPVVGDPAAVVDEAVTTKEGCAYPGALVIVIAQVSPAAVEGCGYFERDPAHQG